MRFTVGTGPCHTRDRFVRPNGFEQRRVFARGMKMRLGLIR